MYVCVCVGGVGVGGVYMEITMSLCPDFLWTVSSELLNGQGHSEGSCNQNMSVSSLSSELMLLLAT